MAASESNAKYRDTMHAMGKRHVWKLGTEYDDAIRGASQLNCRLWKRFTTATNQGVRTQLGLEPGNGHSSQTILQALFVTY